MKSKDFAVALRKFSTVLQAAQASSAEASLQQLAAVFEVAPTATVADAIKKLSAATVNLLAGYPSVHQPALILAELSTFLTGQAKAAFLTDLSTVGAFLKLHSATSVDGLIEAAKISLVRTAPVDTPLRDDLIEKYARQLDIALGDEAGFVSLFKEISENSAIRKHEAAELAKRFTGKPAASKPAAMKKIWARHHNLMTFRAKAESRAGRSAA